MYEPSRIESPRPAGAFDQLNGSIQEQVKRGHEIAAHLEDLAARLLNSEPTPVNRVADARAQTGQPPATVESRLHASACELDALMGRLQDVAQRLARAA